MNTLTMKKIKQAKNGRKKSANVNKVNKKKWTQETGNVTVKFGKPVFRITFQTVKWTVTAFIVGVIVLILLSLKFFVTAIKIRSHLGTFINMIARGDGDILPSILALPVLFFLALNIVLCLFVYKLFSKKKNYRVNWIVFFLIMIGLILIAVTLVLTIYVLVHIYGSHEHLHDGIICSMENYGTNSYYKKQVDRLQIEFQCCGSKRYDEWYNISWYDDALAKKDRNSTKKVPGNTPFSCCSMSSKFPCIHHNIEDTGTSYLYTPEYNLSISIKGCFEILRDKKRSVGLGIVGSLMLIILLQIILLIPVRLLQTGHAENSKFEGKSNEYTVWLIGCYTGRNESNGPPEPPPVPPELMDL
ncbi:rod outer segment membrane protein 1-like [Cylas formicarius]|uniref:rod outer segment membrane protein 1-like n=1 Tax=Cylas formicarius TaxID=197179 RepID=UPI0029588F6C|nr:rod outer segment membrane protein 1-like [Cylas formicarius]